MLEPYSAAVNAFKPDRLIFFFKNSKQYNIVRYNINNTLHLNVCQRLNRIPRVRYNVVVITD